MKLKKLIEKLENVPCSDETEVVLAIKGSKAWWVSGKTIKVQDRLVEGKRPIVFIEGEIK